MLYFAFKHTANQVMCATYQFMGLMLLLLVATICLVGLILFHWGSDPSIFLTVMLLILIGIHFRIIWFAKPLNTNLADHKLDETLDQTIDNLNVEPVSTVSESQINKHIMIELKRREINNTNLTDKGGSLICDFDRYKY